MATRCLVCGQRRAEWETYCFRDAQGEHDHIAGVDPRDDDWFGYAVLFGVCVAALAVIALLVANRWPT